MGNRLFKRCPHPIHSSNHKTQTTIIVRPSPAQPTGRRKSRRLMWLQHPMGHLPCQPTISWRTPMDSVKHWRPSTFSEIIGARNRRTVQRLQRAAIKRQPLAGILLGQYGSAKTSLAQLLMKSYVCQRPGAETGNPCGTCPHCRSVRSDYNGESHTFQHWEIDCSHQQTDSVPPQSWKATRPDKATAGESNRRNPRSSDRHLQPE